ncbi:energy transducer TonB family protein [Pseudomonas fluorescens]|uniref:energy transducer TonB family protein n=1 Tax=Pseudomonas fluorescens TaxID=294 RepID=UPI001BEABED5|nr:energy transducer TonB [Pseudomonas fluorescens]MBT2297011.1 energy transducer TonB [Pseudomonas fluorescens]MBT2308073.1 energy transducer TonB [Pseudomonas fluorescens]MBT2312849.1 energy transducer TonB [Pseudomonas fluorescens]MBT2317600.1 energy transducer TonB [Pseudomonas fluorescens]MBT2343490.1 energy transducer TonB [Pseudomonas fluorescens]
MITTRQKLTRYSGSLAVVLGVHALAIALALNWTSNPPIELPPQAMMVELAPVPAPPPPAPPKVVTPPQPPEPVEELPLPKIAEAEKPEISVPKPVKPKPKPPKPKPKPVEKKPEPPKEEPSEQKPSDAQPTKAPTEKSAQPAPGPSPAQMAAKASWQGTLLAHLGKYKKYPASAQSRGKEGLNRLRFVVDAEGNVLSFELVSKSGNAALDRATLEMIRKAQPLPKPPADMLVNGSIEIVAPFVYSIDKRRR